MSEKNQVTRKGIDVLKGMLEAPSVQQQFENALGENKNTFIASVIDLFNTDTGLQNCDPKKVVMEALKAAVLKLPINKALGFAYIIPFNNSVKQSDGTWLKVPTPTFILGYKAYIQMAMRTGQYRTINADIVYEGEVRRVSKLTGDIAFDGEKKSDKVAGYFAHFELLNGFSKTLYMDLEKVAKHAKKYAPTLTYNKNITVESLSKLAGKDPSGIGWTGDFDNMALKTVVRNLFSKYGYLSIEMQGAIVDDSETIGVDKQIEPSPTIIDIDSEEINDSVKEEEETPPYL